MIGNQCSVTGCARKTKLRKGMCATHYMRQYRTGSAFVVRPPGEVGQGRRKHFMYNAYAGMLNRCHNPNNSSYGRYGAKGIEVCQRWRDDFLNFLSDMGERPAGMTLDRIDTKGNYEPTNCRWADAKTQRANITQEGDNRMREAMSKGVKRYWENRRIAAITAESKLGEGSIAPQGGGLDDS